MKTRFITGLKLKCIKGLKTFCNGENKTIFQKDYIYIVKDNINTPCIQTRENGEGYTFFDNSKDDYFEIIGINDDTTITKDNIHLYYEFMSDEDLSSHSHILNSFFEDRRLKVVEGLNLTDFQDKLLYLICYFTIRGDILSLTTFGTKDTLKPIDEYIEEIKESSKYKEYIDKESYYQFYKDGKWWDKPHKLTVTEAKEEFEVLGLQYKKISTK